MGCLSQKTPGCGHEVFWGAWQPYNSRTVVSWHPTQSTASPSSRWMVPPASLFDAQSFIVSCVSRKIQISRGEDVPPKA